MTKLMIKRIFVIGNAAGGKTRLSQQLGHLYPLPVTHVDSIQFLSDLSLRPHQETQEILDQILVQEKWIVDGFGPLESLEKRFALADRIVFIDLPIWRNYWWFVKRQVKNSWRPRPELPADAQELSWQHSKKVLATMWKIHQQMRPELTRILARENLRDKVIQIRSLKQWNAVFKNGV